MSEPIFTQSGTYACPKCGEPALLASPFRSEDYWYCQAEGCTWRSDREDDE